jgi:hypothetical protein
MSPHIHGGTQKLVSTAEKCPKCGGVKDGRIHCTACHVEIYKEFNAGGRGHPEYIKLLDELKSLHLLKSKGYGTSADPFANFTAVSVARNQPRFVYAVDRAQEKLTRVYSLIAQERYEESGEEFTDLASLFLCAESMRRDDKETS